MMTEGYSPPSYKKFKMYEEKNGKQKSYNKKSSKSGVYFLTNLLIVSYQKMDEPVKEEVKRGRKSTKNKLIILDKTKV